MSAFLWTVLALAAVLGVALTLLTEYAYRHRKQLAAEYRALAALRGCQHARPLAVPQPWAVLYTPRHRAPKGAAC